MTINQERLFFPIPRKELHFSKPIEIDIGSRYAAQLGFGGIEVYHEEPLAADAALKKKKKKRKKKKKGEGSDGDGKDADDAD